MVAVMELHTSLPDNFGDSSTTLLSYDEIPEWYQDNIFIHEGYRPESKSTRACLSSWVYMHNETVNIYSHLIPGIIFLAGEGAIYQYFRAKYPTATVVDYLIFAFFLLTAATCLGLSAMYHTLLNHSAHVSHLWLQFDLVGIIVLTLGDFVSAIYVGFYCKPTLQSIYCAMIFSLSLITIFLLLSHKFQGHRNFRVCMFISTALSGCAPLAHGINIYGFVQMQRQSGMLYFLGEGLLLIIGALFYIMRFPESLKPGRFDKFGCSHQIFHILVVIATVVHLIGICSAFDYNYQHQSCGTSLAFEASPGQ